MPKHPILLSFSISMLVMAACSRSPDGNASSDSIVVKNGVTAAPLGPAAAETHGQEFVSAVLGRYDFALQSARLVSGRADRPNVKLYAQGLADDLARSLDELKAIAGTGRLKLEAAPGETAQTDLAILSSAQGAPLAKAFADRQMENLSALIGTLRAYKNGGDNPELKAWAEKYQGVLNARLLDLQTLNAKIEETSEKTAG